MTAGLPKGKLAVEVSVVTVADPLPYSTVPHTTAVSAVAVFHGQAADAMFPVKVVVPWEHHSHISHVSLTFRVAPGFDAEVVLVDPAYVLCESRVVEDPAIESSAAPLAAGVEVVVTADGAPFTCGVKFTNHRGTLSAVLGETGETLAFEAYSRLYGR